VIKLDKELSAKGKHAILWDYNNTYFTWPILAAGGGLCSAAMPKAILIPARSASTRPVRSKAAKCWPT